MSIVNLQTHRSTYDWYDDYIVPVDLDLYTYFQVEYRCGFWHVIGHKCSGQPDYLWTTDELSGHWCTDDDIISFIRSANSAPDKNGWIRCRVSSFTNLHYDTSYYSRLAKILAACMPTVGL